MAKDVRYERAVRRDGRIRQSDVREAILIKRSHLLGGGYPARERRLTPDQREAVFARDIRRCRACGAPATQIDHIGQPICGEINHPDNLQALCRECHTRKTQAGLRPIPRELRPAWVPDYERRVRHKVPLRPCDDEVRWDTIRWSLAAERARAAEPEAPWLARRRGSGLAALKDELLIVLHLDEKDIARVVTVAQPDGLTVPLNATQARVIRRAWGVPEGVAATGQPLAAQVAKGKKGYVLTAPDI